MASARPDPFRHEVASRASEAEARENHPLFPKGRERGGAASRRTQDPRDTAYLLMENQLVAACIAPDRVLPNLDRGAT